MCQWKNSVRKSCPQFRAKNPASPDVAVVRFFVHNSRFACLVLVHFVPSISTCRKVHEPSPEPPVLCSGVHTSLVFRRTHFNGRYKAACH